MTVTTGRAKQNPSIATFSSVVPIALEPRFMFDAAGAATAADAASDAQAEAEAEQSHDGAPESGNDTGDHDGADIPAATGSDSGARREIMVVDTSVAGWQDLISDLAPGTETILLDGTKGGIAQLAQALAGQTGIDAIHILSHGDTGMIKLGTDTLTTDTLAGYADALSVISASLGEQGDILLYGCLVGEGGEGQAFVDALGALTGADIAASDDLTGASDLGGDWDLEIITGDIEATTPLSSVAMNNFAGVLAGGDVTFDFESATGTLAGGALGDDISVSQTIGGETAVTVRVGGAILNNSDTWLDSNIISGDNVVAFDGIGVEYLEISGDDSFGLKGFDFYSSEFANLKVIGYNGSVKSFTFYASGGYDSPVSTVGSQYSGTNIQDFQITSFKIMRADGEIFTNQGNLNYFDNLIISNVTSTPSNTAPTVTSTGGSASFTEDAGAISVDSDLTITEPEGDNISGATVSITGNFLSGDTLAVTESGDITAEYDSVTGVLTLSGTATAAAYQTVLRTVTFNSASNDPGNATRTITYSVTDAGSNTAGTATRDVTVTPVNNAPTLTATGGTPSFTENGSAVDLFSDVEISTVESGQTISGMTFTVTNAEASDRITFDGTAITLSDGASGTTGGNSLTYNVSIADGIATVTISGGSMTTAAAQTVIDGMTYSSTSENPGTANRVVTLTGITDNGGIANGGVDSASVTVVSTVTVNSVNDAPVATTSGGSTSFTEGGAAAFIDSSFTLSDVDTTNMTGATIEITGGYETPWDQLDVQDAFAFQAAGVSYSYDSSEGIMTLEGTATAAQYQALIRQILYFNNSPDPSMANRTISITVNDGTTNSDVATKTLTVTSVNESPAFSGLNGSPSFTEEGSAVVLDGNVTVSDEELGSLNGGDGNFAGASVVLVRNGGANASDVFSMISGGGLTVNGSNIESGGNVIASFDTSIDGELTITFQNNGTIPTTALVNQVMQAIRYSNSSNDPASSVQIDWTFSDGNTGNAQGTGDNPGTATGSVTVSITGVNNAPTLSATGGDPTYVEGAGGADLFNTVEASAIEAADHFNAMTMTVTNVSDGASEIIRFDGSDVALTNGNVLTTATNGLNVSVSVSGSTATISFTGASLTSAQMQTLVDGLTYRNSSDNPTTSANRVVTITGVTDSGSGSNSAAPNLISTVTLTGVNDAPVPGNLDGDNSALQAGNAANIDEDGNFTLSNPDSVDYNGGSLVITPDSGNSANGSFSLDGTNATSDGDGTIEAGETISVGGVAIGTVDATDDGQGGHTLSITFNADATDARIQTLVRNIQWSASAGSGAQSFDLVINDNDGTANAGVEEASASFTMTLGNPAVIAGLGGDSVNFAEGDSAVVLDANSDLSITDADSPASYDGGNLTVSVSGNAQTGEDILTLVTTGNVSLAGTNVSVGGTVIGTLANTIAAGNDLVINFNSDATVERVQELARAVAYLNESQNPTESTRSISMTLTDNDGLVSTAVASSVVVSAVNDAPTLGNGGSPVVTITEDVASNFDLTAITISDVDNSTLTVTIAASAGTFAATSSGGVTIGGSGTGTITLQGTTADINTYLDTASNIKYTGAANANGPAAATYTIHANDGTVNPQIGGGNINITAVNDAPVIGSLSGDSVNYTAGQTIRLDAGQNALLTDVDSSNFNGGTLTVSISAGLVAGQDILTLSTSGTTITLGGTTAGSTVSVGGTIIGTLDNAIAAGNNLVITLNGDATPANVQEVVRAVAYQNTAGTPTFANRTVSFTLSDGDGATSNAITTTVVVTAPVVTPPPPPPPAPPPAPVVTIPPILQTPGSGGDAGTPVSNALSGGSNGSGSGGQFISGGPIQTTVTGQLGNTSPIGNSGTPVSAGLSINQAGSGLGVTTGLGGGGGAVLTSGGFGGSGLGGGLGGGIGGGFGGGGLGGGGLGGGLGGGGLGGGLGGAGAFGGAGGDAGTGTPGGNDGILGAPSPGGEGPGTEGGTDGETSTGDGNGDQAMSDGNSEAELAKALDDFTAQLAAFGDAAEMETMLLDQVLGTYRIPA